MAIYHQQSSDIHFLSSFCISIFLLHRRFFMNSLPPVELKRYNEYDDLLSSLFSIQVWITHVSLFSHSSSPSSLSGLGPQKVPAPKLARSRFDFQSIHLKKKYISISNSTSRLSLGSLLQASLLYLWPIARPSLWFLICRVRTMIHVVWCAL